MKFISRTAIGLELRGAVGKNFGETWDFVPTRGCGGGGSDPIPTFLNQNHMVILLGFCHNKGGFPVPTLFTQKMGLFHEK